MAITFERIIGSGLPTQKFVEGKDGTEGTWVSTDVADYHELGATYIRLYKDGNESRVYGHKGQLVLKAEYDKLKAEGKLKRQNAEQPKAETEVKTEQKPIQK